MKNITTLKLQEKTRSPNINKGLVIVNKALAVPRFIINYKVALCLALAGSMTIGLWLINSLICTDVVRKYSIRFIMVPA